MQKLRTLQMIKPNNEIWATETGEGQEAGENVRNKSEA